MIRDKAISKGIGTYNHFRWRSKEVTRLEAFSDAVFAFALTLLVVSLEVPKTFDDLLLAMRGFFAFAVCFTTLVGIWYTHYIYFRRYGLVNYITIAINAALLFVVLFYVYPLKFLFTILINQFFGDLTATLADGAVVPVIRQLQIPKLMLIYGLGYVAVFVIFLLFYLHAWRARVSLALTRVELHITKQAIQRKCIYISIGILQVTLAVSLSPEHAGLSGFVYFLIGPGVTIHSIVMEKRRKLLTINEV